MELTVSGRLRTVAKNYMVPGIHERGSGVEGSGRLPGGGNRRKERGEEPLQE